MDRSLFGEIEHKKQKSMEARRIKMDGMRETQEMLKECSCLETPQQEAELLTKILNLSKGGLPVLEQLARGEGYADLVRCAAVDRYVELHSDPQTLLDDLADYRKVSSEHVRLVAIQWLSSFEGRNIRTRGPLRTRGSIQRGGEGRSEGDWKKRAAEDPSSRIQWFASLNK
jgi:hypothetical protein